MMFTEQEIPTDAPCAPILYCPACGGAISLETIPIEMVIEGVKSQKPMLGMWENTTLNPEREHTTLENCYV